MNTLPTDREWLEPLDEEGNMRILANLKGWCCIFSGGFVWLVPMPGRQTECYFVPVEKALKILNSAPMDGPRMDLAGDAMPIISCFKCNAVGGQPHHPNCPIQEINIQQ